VTPLVKSLRLGSVRSEAEGLDADKDTDEAFKQADDAVGELDRAMSDMENDIKRAAPTAGMQLSIAA
jgi:hypothetical protein